MKKKRKLNITKIVGLFLAIMAMFMAFQGNPLAWDVLIAGLVFDIKGDMEDAKQAPPE